MVSLEPAMNSSGSPQMLAIESRGMRASISVSDAAQVEGTCATSGPLRVAAAKFNFDKPLPQSKMVTSTFSPGFSM